MLLNQNGPNGSRVAMTRRHGKTRDHVLLALPVPIISTTRLAPGVLSASLIPKRKSVNTMPSRPIYAPEPDIRDGTGYFGDTGRTGEGLAVWPAHKRVLCNGCNHLLVENYEPCPNCGVMLQCETQVTILADKPMRQDAVTALRFFAPATTWAEACAALPTLPPQAVENL